MASSKPSPESVPPEAKFVGLPKKVTELLEKESDRGVVLILAAYLEEILGLIVRAAYTSDQLGKSLLEFRSPAGDFSSKIMLCEAFGLISPDEAKALNTLRKIRNSAAHFDQKGRGFDVLFDSAQTIEQVKAFVAFINLELTSENAQAAREVFIIAGRLLGTRLYIRLATAQRHAVPSTLKEAANFFRERMRDTPRGKEIAEAEEEARAGRPEKLMEMLQSTVDGLRGQLETSRDDTNATA